MKATIPKLLLAALAGLMQFSAFGAGHPELTPADEAFSAENYDLAAKLYRRDAEIGVAAAQVNLAFLYLDGQGVAQDFAQAASWFQRAAEQGNAEAQQNLGALYRDGKGVAQSNVEAAKWFLIAGADADAKSLEKDMNAEQIAEARKLAESWQAKFGKPRSR
jgi:uncharacterized protein